MTLADLVPRLRTRLASPLPGPLAHAEMAPLGRDPDLSVLDPTGKKGRLAATLVLFYPGPDASPMFVLTVRQASLRDHSGQISLPGGSRDGKETAEETARREAYEEVGVDPDALDVLGRLSRLYIPPSGFSVTPVVAAVMERPPFTPHEAEVAALLEVPLMDLLDPVSRRSSRRSVRGGAFDVPFFELAGHEVWGATAMMLAELASVVSDAVSYSSTGSTA
ncbi:MAG: CoA pyrophosphatase [Rubricoccaceae bacterium]